MTIKFKTSAKCQGCVARIEKALDGKLPREAWDIDLSVPDHIMTVTGEELQAQEIMGAVRRAGFRIESV